MPHSYRGKRLTLGTQATYRINVQGCLNGSWYDRSTERYAYYRSQPEGTRVGDDPGGPGEGPGRVDGRVEQPL